MALSRPHEWKNEDMDHIIKLFRCASISWFQVVSQSVIDVFRLAHLRVFQSYFGRGASLTNTKKQKKGKGKWCKWCVNNTCVWSKANSWFGLCVFIKRTKFAQIVVTLFSYEGKTGFICFCLLSMKNRLTLYFVWRFCAFPWRRVYHPFAKGPIQRLYVLKGNSFLIDYPALVYLKISRLEKRLQL